MIKITSNICRGLTKSGTQIADRPEKLLFAKGATAKKMD